MTLKKIKAINIFMLLVAGVINDFAATFFLVPVSLYDSGISGTSMLLSQVTPEYLSLSVFLLVLNIPLFTALKSRVHCLPFIPFSQLAFILFQLIL